MNLLSLFRRPPSARDQRFISDTDRLQNYERYYRAYRGYSIRAPGGSLSALETRRLRFNFNRPIVNLSAAFMASKPLSWNVEGDPEATTAAAQIWERSGSDRLLLEASRAAAIFGEVVILATAEEDGDPRLEFVDPGICFPVFGSADPQDLLQLEITYEKTILQGDSREPRQILRREFYTQDGLTIFEDGVEVERRAYDQLPAAWVQNLGVKGDPWGISDLEGVADLNEEYDHVASKRTRILDYWASPTPWVKGVRQGDKDFEKNISSVWFLPENGECGFMEWKGSTPDYDAQLTVIRNALSEQSQVPAVAFGQMDKAATQISGVAMRILYGPLLAKVADKRAHFGPGLQRVMTVALNAAGFAVDVEQVKAIWQDPLPVNGVEQAQTENVKVQGELQSRRTAMLNLGVEDPDGELKRILVEQLLLGGASPVPPTMPAPPQPPMPMNAPADAQNAPGDTPAAPAPPPAPEPVDMAARVAELLQTVDDALKAESDSLAADAEGATG